MRLSITPAQEMTNACVQRLSRCLCRRRRAVAGCALSRKADRMIEQVALVLVGYSLCSAPLLLLARKRRGAKPQVALADH